MRVLFGRHLGHCMIVGMETFNNGLCNRNAGRNWSQVGEYIPSGTRSRKMRSLIGIHFKLQVYLKHENEAVESVEFS